MKSESLDWRLEYARSVFAEEADAMHRIRDRVSFVVGLCLTPTVSLAYYLFSAYPGQLFDLASSFFFLLLMAAPSFLLVLALGYLISMLGTEHRYSAPPLPSDVTDFFNEFADSSVGLIKVKEGLLLSYESAAKHNTKINKDRTALLVSVQKLSLLSVPFLVLASLVFAWQSIGKPDPVVRIEIVK